MRYVTSDLHFRHTNIIEYCKRPFASTEEMEDGLVEEIKSKVGPNDDVYHLGDFTFSTNVEVFMGIFDKLPGK
jgi:calcineurin-like phosphoesterase family protein